MNSVIICQGCVKWKLQKLHFTDEFSMLAIIIKLLYVYGNLYFYEYNWRKCNLDRESFYFLNIVTLCPFM